MHPYLQELKDALEERVGVEVSDTTVWRTLTRTGFTMKKVRLHCILCFIGTDGHRLHVMLSNAMRKIDVATNTAMVALVSQRPQYLSTKVPLTVGL